MTGDFASRVTVSGLSGLTALSAGIAWAAGLDAAAGVAGGGAIALLNFRWLARDVAHAATLAAEGRMGTLRVGSAWLRRLVSLGALGLLLAGGLTHPLAVIAGLWVLPPVLLLQGLRAARQAD
jgi:hypothetical protein